MDKVAYEEIGFVRYSGEKVLKGIIDAESAGIALIGLSDSLKFFNAKQAPSLGGHDYAIPVRTQEGSWEAVVMGMAAVAGTFGLSYAKKAGEKLAENDFKEVSTKDLFRKSLEAIKQFITLVKHTRQTKGWASARVINEDSNAMVVVKNEANIEIQVPLEFFRWYQTMPPNLLAKLASVVETERALIIGISHPNRETDTETITVREKRLFDDSAEDDDVDEILFPELVHGHEVTLTGRVIRGSEKSNSIGLEYSGHVLNCMPITGSVRQYKGALFLRCTIQGRVTRQTKGAGVADRRPTIILNCSSSDLIVQ